MKRHFPRDDDMQMTIVIAGAQQNNSYFILTEQVKLIKYRQLFKTQNV